MPVIPALGRQGQANPSSVATTELLIWLKMLTEESMQCQPWAITRICTHVHAHLMHTETQKPLQLILPLKTLASPYAARLPPLRCECYSLTDFRNLGDIW